MGDINFMRESLHSENYLINLQEFDLQLCINGHTKIKSNYSICLDPIFIKTYINNKNILPIMLDTRIEGQFSIIITFLLMPNTYKIRMINYEN